MKYSFTKQIVQALGVREFGATIFTLFPDFISKHIYSFMRAAIFRDEKQRLRTFQVGFEKFAPNHKTGSYLEFGVARGTSVISSYKMSRKQGINDMNIFAFDSFAGLPSAEGKFYKGEMSYGESIFRTFCQKGGVDMSMVTTIPGLFNESCTPETIDALNLKPDIHFIHVDCDLYESTKDVLAFVGPLLLPGSIIIFDDWHAFDEKENPEQWGEQKAFKEWNLSTRFEKIAEHPNWNCGFVMV